MVRHGFALILVTAMLANAQPSGAADSAKKPVSKSVTAAGNTQFLMFGMQPAGNYEVRQNTTLDRSVVASPLGSVDMDDVTGVGDTYVFTLTGVEPVTPGTPTGFAAAGSTNGCATLSWNAPPTAEYVTDYTLLWRRTGTVFTDSAQVSLTDIVQAGSRWSTTRCGFANGTYTFAIRAHNAFDLWSGRSNEASATVTNENTQGPPPPTGIAGTENPVGCLRVSWTRVGDPTVTGYRMYFATRPRSQGAYTDSVDVSGTTSVASRCGLSAGTYFASVRSFTGAGLMSIYSSEVSVTLQGPDVTPPVVSQRDPASGATNVARNTGIFFVVTDARSGVDAASIVVRVNGIQETPVTTATTSGYAVSVDPAADLPANTAITVQVTAADRAPTPNVLTTSWTFTTGASASNDVLAPTIAAVTPLANATGVSASGAIEVDISDSGLGVALGSVQLIINGSNVAFTVQGTPASVRITHRPASPFTAGAQVSVRVEACDRASTSNCAVPFEYSFTVAGSNLASGTGDIVPDGYWAGDPARPLEVRNLPRAWTVRIFDAAGFTVRRFENTGSDGANWTWDFANDGGQRVAPALYLVRVTDSSGSLQRAGRFLVQSGR
ncbi:MAG TPA: Ig-like domain-containing protein [Candidatus Krumholzibacteria bacterium]|nr:Ig-like domain-containing protein [Candidatus Krumholzibacteria bacterium]